VLAVEAEALSPLSKPPHWIALADSMIIFTMIKKKIPPCAIVTETVAQLLTLAPLVNMSPTMPPTMHLLCWPLRPPQNPHVMLLFTTHLVQRLIIDTTPPPWISNLQEIPVAPSMATYLDLIHLQVHPHTTLLTTTVTVMPAMFLTTITTQCKATGTRTPLLCPTPRLSSLLPFPKLSGYR
jgi:hypothetical protein